FTEHATPVPRGHNLQVEGDNGGPLLMKILTEAVNTRSVDVHYDSRALTLIVNDAGAVEGLVVRIDQQEKTVRARKGVILCAGGFCMNEEMVKKYAPTFDCGLIPIGNPGDTGSGILMGMGAGAGTTNMHECFVSLPYYPPASLTYGILVNDKAQRFINEDCYHGRVGYNALIAQRNSSRIYFITDVEGYGDYEKMSYLGATVAGTGDSIAELEQELALPEGSLQYTVNTYNKHAKTGDDPYFHKHEAWLRPIKPPYVALDCTLGRGPFYPFFTLGGLDTLSSGEVLTPEGSIIKGLYAAGRTTAGIPRTAAGYASGMSVGDVTYFGRMAGKTASR
ncbi:MAG: FAD-binding protein, partial [Zhongshania sp.]|nr:FAD-binding protein [Zhongshania sp.]